MSGSCEAKSNRLPCLSQVQWPGVVILIAMLPSVYWITNDHHVWPYDQAWYGEVSVDLWFALSQRFSTWWPAMVAAFGSKTPGTAWFGQFFVPFGQAIGSIEIGLLWSVLAVQIGSLFFAWKIAEEYAPGRKLVACVGVLVFASAPLFVALSHQYLVEPLQLFGVTYFYFLAARAHRMQRETLLGNLLLATAIALLAKVTSPIYCALPGLIATAALFQKRDSGNKASRKGVLWGWLFVFAGLLLCALCAKWYSVNLQALRENVKLVTSLEVTKDYGRPGTYFPKMAFWLGALQCSFQMPLVIIGQLLLFCAGVAAWKMGTGRDGEPQDAGRAPLNLLAIASVIHILGVISVCSLNYNEENRYLLPLLPAVATLDLWLVRRIRSSWLLAGVIVLFCYQWIAVCTQALGFTHNNPRISYWVLPFDKSRTQAKEMARIAHRTSKRSTNQRINVVGVEVPWLNANSMSFYAAKAQLKSGVRAYYTSVGYAAKDMELAWTRLEEMKISYFVSLEESAQPVPNFVNEISLPVLTRIRDDPEFEQDSFASKLGVVIFRRNEGKSKAATPGSAAQ